VTPVENNAPHKRNIVLKHTRGLLYLTSCLALLSSCVDGYNPSDPTNPNKHDIIDPRANLTREDYRGLNEVETYQNRPGEKAGNIMEPPIPDLAEILTLPSPPKLGETKLVSVAVTDDIPLKDVLIELARLAEVDIEVDSGVTGGIAFRAKDRPFNEVIARIADMAGLRYNMKNNVLRVERDTPYIHTYRLDMLNIDRSSSANIGVGSTGGNSQSGSSGSTGGTSGGGSNNNRNNNSSGSGSGSGSSLSSSGNFSGSNSNIVAESKSDFWAKFEESLTKIIAYQPTALVSATTIAAQPVQGQPEQANGAPQDPNAPQNFNAPPPAPVAPSQQPPAANGAAPATATGNSNVAGSFYSLNRQAGTLTVSATERQHEVIRQFLNEIESNISSQVLIEAKIVEVALSDNYQSGINWTNFGTSSIKFSGDLDGVTSSNTSIGAPTITLLKDNLLGPNIDLSTAVKLLSEFGTTRALSSPRLNAMNNQQAVLSFVENLLYFDVKIKVTPGTAGTATTAATQPTVDVDSTPETAPVGIVLTLQPSINQEAEEITLSVRPTLSKVTKFVPDPGFEIGKANAAALLDASSPIIDTLQAVESQIPQLEVRELDSIMKVKSGQVMVIGGLLEDKVINTDAGVPGVSEVPYLGNLFKSVTKTTSKKELVILIRATIVSPHGSVDKADKGLYQKFIKDPRPLEFQ
jgi:MSHA biogenesis protein MshL